MMIAVIGIIKTALIPIQKIEIASEAKTFELIMRPNEYDKSVNQIIKAK